MNIKQSAESQVATEREQIDKKKVKEKESGKNTKKRVSVEDESSSVYSVGTDDVELVVNGEGYNLTEATQNALRSAIEQAYGVFVSSNTTILDDEIVQDEIATVSSGNIKAYKELASMKLPNGNTSVTISAIVTISNLVSYVQSHGGSAEFAGQTFLMNYKTMELNKNNEIKVMENVCQELQEFSHTLYDYSLILGEPKSAGSGFYLPICIVISPNENFKSWKNKFSATLSALSMSDIEYAQWKQNDMVAYDFYFYGKRFRLRNRYDNGNATFDEMIRLLNSWESGFIITMNDGDKSWEASNDIKSTQSGFRFLNSEGIDIYCMYHCGIDEPQINVLWKDSYMHNHDIGIGRSRLGPGIESFPSNQIQWYLTIAFPFPSADELGEVRKLEIRPKNNF